MAKAVWPHKVERNEHKRPLKVVMTNGAVGIIFIIRDGEVVEMENSRLRVDGSRIVGPESLLMPPVHYKEAWRIACGILLDKRKRASKS